jgi:hypothetical protein
LRRCVAPHIRPPQVRRSGKNTTADKPARKKDREGELIKKMRDCTGVEILKALLYHLKFSDYLPEMLRTANCIPFMMPFITSPFMLREQRAPAGAAVGVHQPGLDRPIRRNPGRCGRNSRLKRRFHTHRMRNRCDVPMGTASNHGYACSSANNQVRLR